MFSIDPVILFFILGIVASIARSGLRVPKDFYDTLGIYLLLAIGIKGGIDLATIHPRTFFIPAIGTIVLGTFITFLAYFILRKAGKIDRPDAVSIAAHYGSVSVVTFAVATSYLQRMGIGFEEFSTLLLVTLEVVGIVVGVFLSRITNAQHGSTIANVLREVFLGKGVLLLIGGLIIGLFSAMSGNTEIHPFFVDLFKGFLALFMLEMGVITLERLSDLKKLGLFLLIFGITMPLLSAFIGIATGILLGLSVGGITLLATMAASASYIAAPAAMRMAEPHANPTLSMTAALGITFPFNVVIGIPLYYHSVQWIVSFLG